MKFGNIGKNAMTIAKGIGGGAGGRVITNKVMPMVPFVKNYPKLHGVATALVGAALMDVKKMEDVGFGMAVVAGTDALGKFVPMVSASGIGDDILETLADELAEEMEASVNDDVSDVQDSMNGDDDDAVNGDDDDAVNGDDDYSVSDDVSSPQASMNSI